jgi:RNA polymerase sigma-70 factor, ECF subfamily
VPQDDVRKLLVGELDAVFRLAYDLCARHQEAEDAVQETYLRAFKAAHTFHLTEFGPRPWLFKILHNVIFSRISANLRESVSIAQMQHEGTPTNSQETENSHPSLAHLRWDSIDERLKHAIQSLPLPARTTLLLCAVEGLKYREIAEVMEVPVGTVMSRLYRARADVAAVLGAYAREQGWSSDSHGAPNSDGASDSVANTER